MSEDVKEQKAFDKNDRPSRRRGSNYKSKVCKFCANKDKADYKKPETLKRYVTERGKILAARVTGNCAKHQREVTREIKKARVLAYLPFEKK